MPIYFANGQDATTPNMMRKMRKLVKDTRAEYVEARRHALAVCASDANYIAKEDALSEAMHARHWYYIELKRLRRFEEIPCVKGSAMCPAAQARAVASGRMRAD